MVAHTHGPAEHTAQVRAAELAQLRAGHFPAAFVAVLEAIAEMPDGAPEPERARAACDVRAWYLGAGLPVPPPLERACEGARELAA